MSNFADIAYDNYLMHYRTKGSKNGYAKDPDYTPVGERANIERANGERRNEINMRSAQARRGDYAGMPSSVGEAQEKAERASEISRLSKQASKGDYAGMPSSALAAKERASIERENARMRNAANRMKANAEAKRKAEYMKADAEAKRKKEYDLKARKDEISKLSEQASRGDYAGMPSSARSGNAYVKYRLAFKEWARKEREKDARERARRNLQIDKLSRQKSKGDYAGMPTSAKEAQARAKEEKFWKKYEKAREETKRKKEWNPNATYAGGKRLMMPK